MPSSPSSAPAGTTSERLSPISGRFGRSSSHSLPASDRRNRSRKQPDPFVQTGLLESSPVETNLKLEERRSPLEKGISMKIPVVLALLMAFSISGQAHANRLDDLTGTFRRADPIQSIQPNGNLRWKDGSTQVVRPNPSGGSHITIYNGTQGSHYSFDRRQNGTFYGGHWTDHHSGSIQRPH